MNNTNKDHPKILKEDFTKSFTHTRPKPSTKPPTQRSQSQDANRKAPSEINKKK